MAKILLIVMFIGLTGCISQGNQAPTASSWNESFRDSKVEPVNKNLTEIQHELDNKNVF